MRIVYGGPDAAEMGRTFLEALEQVCDGGHVRVVSPYLAPTRLDELLQGSARLSVITDFSACFGALNARDRVRLLEIVRDRADAFRHVPDVHAKVVFSQSRVLIGSANLTARGLEERDELGVLFHEATQLAEAREWFAALWDRGVRPEANYLERWFSTLPAWSNPAVPPFAPENNISAPKSAEAKKRPEPSRSRAKIRPLDEVLREPGSSDWVRRFLGAVRWIYDHLALEADDPRLMLTTPQDKHINLTINNRWVLQHTRDYTHVRIIMPTTQARTLAKRNKTSEPWQFGRRGDEVDPPSMVFLPGFTYLTDPTITTSYLKVLRATLLYGNRTPNRHHHRPDLLALALNPDELERTLRALNISG